MNQPDATRSKAPALLGCGALILLTIVVGAGFLYSKAQANRVQSRSDAMAVLEQVLAKDYQVPKGEEAIRLVTRGSYADSYEAEPKDLGALRRKVGEAPEQVLLVEQKEWFHSPEVTRPSGFDLSVDLVRGGQTERWSFRYHYKNLPLARVVILRSGQRRR